MRTLRLLALVSAFILSVHARASETSKYYDIQNVEITAIENSAFDDSNNLNHEFSLGHQLKNPIDEILEIVGWQDIVAVGKTVWQIIEAGKPVADVQTNSLSILPKLEGGDWSAMENWKGPRMAAYKIEAKNGFGMTVIGFHYRLFFNYGGSYQGRGQFISNLTVIPESINVAWAYNLEAKVSASEFVNFGTKEQPVPGVGMQVHWKITNPLKHNEGIDTFFVKGSGEVIRAIDQK